MNRREFIAASSSAAAWAAPSSAPSTILYHDRATPAQSRTVANDLWVRAADLPRINDFELKPQGACRADLCIPVSKQLRSGQWFNLTAFARQVHQSYVGETGAWSFGEIPLVRGDFYRTRMAPDFGVPDRSGRIVHLSDFRGKKALVVTWASW